MHFEILECDIDYLRTIPGYENESCFSKEEVGNYFDRTILTGYVTNTFVDQEIFGESPIRSVNDLIFYEQLDVINNLFKEVKLNYNEVQLKDSYFHVWDRYQTEENNFLSVETSSQSTLRTLNPTAYF